MIQALSLSQLAKQTKGHLVGQDHLFEHVAIDSRQIMPDDIYFAIKGERFDGHDFIAQAVEQGCSGIVLSQEDKISEMSANTPYIKVADTVSALGACASLNRENFKGKVVALTGSTGKTSTKNILEKLLLQKGPTCATQGNYNNEVGVPLTLLRIKKEDRFAVVEMGARKQGDIQYLSQFVKPDVAILLNAGTAHIDIFGSQENIVKGKGEIFTSLKSDASAVVNLDDPAHQYWLDSLNGKSCLTFSLSNSQADVFASDIELDETASSFNLNYAGQQQKVYLPLPGLHSIANSLAASAAVIHLGFDLTTIANGLLTLESAVGRLNTNKVNPFLTLIDDTYNANPSSMRAGLDVLAMKKGIKIAVLGEMAELGGFSEKLHLELADFIKQKNFDRIYLIGAYAKKMAQLIGSNAVSANTKLDILESLAQKDAIFEAGTNKSEMTTILVKGSRSATMDELVDMIMKKATQ